MKHTDLKQDDLIIFLRKDDLLNKETYEEGNVVKVYPHRESMDIVWLEGYNCRVDNVPFSKAIAKYDKDGEVMTFGIFRGPSKLLKI